jgi:hypothetical protein
MLGSIIYHEFKDGAMRLVQQLTYSNGKTVRRLLDTQTRMPIAILNDKEEKA